MGASESKTVADLVNQVSAEVIMRNMSSCSGQSDQYMNINNTGNTWFTNYSQTSSVNMTCIANFQVDNSVIIRFLAQSSKKHKNKVLVCWILYILIPPQQKFISETWFHLRLLMRLYKKLLVN